MDDTNEKSRNGGKEEANDRKQTGEVKERGREVEAGCCKKRVGVKSRDKNKQKGKV